jgi:hypothetical protein
MSDQPAPAAAGGPLPEAEQAARRAASAAAQLAALRRQLGEMQPDLAAEALAIIGRMEDELRTLRALVRPAEDGRRDGRG